MNTQSFRHRQFLSYLRSFNISQYLISILNKKHPFFSTLTLFALALGIVATLAYAMPPQSANAERLRSDSEPVEISAVVEVMTDSPSTADSVPIRSSGIWRNACTPQYSHHIVEESSSGADSFVLITAVAEPADVLCGQAETPWDFTVDVDLATPGSYVVVVEILSEWYQEPQLNSSTSMWVNGSVTIQPETPQTGESVTITVDGINPDACVPIYESHQISDNTVVIEADKAADQVCGQVPTSWSVSVEMGSMAEGSYAVEAYITSYPAGEPIRELYQSREILIGSPRRQQQQFFYLPGFIIQ